MNPIIDAKREQITELCRAVGVQRLDVFGSVTRDDFDAADSDLDFLVTIGDKAAPDYAEAWLTLHERLESLLGRKIDLITLDALRNPYFRAEVLNTRAKLYEA
ncbi:nucleotidyltransferase family protein [Rhodocyclaceae bacterium SMB388]